MTEVEHLLKKYIVPSGVGLNPRLHTQFTEWAKN